MKKKPGLTIEQHEFLRAHLLIMRDDLGALCAALYRIYPTEDTAHPRAQRAMGLIDRLCVHLENNYARDHRQVSSRPDSLVLASCKIAVELPPGSQQTAITAEQHEFLGLHMQTIRDDLGAIGTVLDRAYPKKDKGYNLAWKACWHIDQLRHHLEERFARDHRQLWKSQDPHGPAGLLRTYYRAGRPDYELPTSREIGKVLGVEQ